MKQKFIVVILTIFIVLPVTGCWSRRELNTLAIAAAIGIDKSDNQYRVSIQIVNPSEISTSKGGSGYQTPVTVYTTSANSLFEAIEKMATVASRKVFLAHLRVVVISEALAREGIGPAIDFLVRDPEIRDEDLYTLIAKGVSAEETLKVLTHLEKIPAMKMFGSLKILDKYWAPTSANKVTDFTFDLIDRYTQPAIAGIEIKGEKGKGNTKDNVESVKPPTRLLIQGTAVFNKDKLIGWLDETESKGFNLITDRVKKAAEHLTCPNGGIMAINILRTKTKITGHIENGEPRIGVELRMVGNVAEVQCDMDLTQPKTIIQVQKAGEEQFLKIIQVALDKAQHEFKSDILGFGEALHRSNPSKWRKIEQNWTEIYPNVPVKVKTVLKLQNIGNMSNSIVRVPEE